MLLTYTDTPDDSFLSGFFHLIMSAIGTDRKERAQLESYYIQVVENYSGIIASICRSFSSSQSDFDDLKQDALLNIWKGISSFREDSDIRTWIYRITLNTCVSTYRKQSRRGVSVAIDNAAPIEAEENPLWEETQWLEKMVSSLPTADHAIIMMWLDEMTYEEIARVMGMNRNTVATRVRRIKQYLSKLSKDFSPRSHN